MLDRLNKYIDLDFATFTSRLASFHRSEMNDMIRYYSGDLSLSTSPSFDTLKYLKEFVQEALRLLDLSSFKLLCDSEDVDSFMLLSEIQHELRKISSINKWMRSSIRDNSLTPISTVSYLTQSGETLHHVSQRNGLQTWYGIAQSNNLQEEDYSLEGNLPLKIASSNFGTTVDIQSVVAVMDENEAYGRDINRDIQFVQDDLAVVNHKQCLYQSAQILTSLRKGDNPFSNTGIDSLIVNSTTLSLSYESLWRQLVETVATDDTFDGIKIKSVRVTQDASSLELELQSRLGEKINI